MPPRLPPLRALAAFEVAAQHLSFTRAASSLYVTQAAVSHQIKALEDRLGVTLFNRLGRGQGLELTEAGREYLPRVIEAFDIIRAATAELKATKPKQPRALTVSSLDSFTALWLLPRLPRFFKRHPDIDVHIVAANMEDEILANDSIDIDIRYGGGNWPDSFAVRQILTEAIFPVCSPELLETGPPLLTPSDLAEHTLLHDVMVVDWRQWLIAAGLPDLHCSRGPAFNHSHLVVQAAISGAGVALGRSVLVSDALHKGLLVRPFPVAVPSAYSYHLIHAKHVEPKSGVPAFIRWIEEEATQTQAEIDAAFAPA